MFGLVGKFTAQAGKREALISALAAATGELPGCLSYIVARDASDADTIWITEVWDNADSHAASLKLPVVQQAIQQARPWIRGMERIATTEPVSGVGPGRS
jgi:quinol monooxygenase YgiN